jgi:NHLM bacteriocin system ABC transporter ATP-binding protein
MDVHAAIDTTPHSLKGSEILLLDDPQTVRVIQSGSVALFAVQVQDGILKGERRYLFNVYPGEALFGITPNHSAAWLGVIAVPLEPTELLQMALPHPNFPFLVESWLHQLGQTRGWPQPQILYQSLEAQYLEPAETKYVALTKGQVYQPKDNQICWIQIQQGRALWLGNPELTIDRSSGMIPLGHLMWLEADDDLELFAEKTSDIHSCNSLLDGLVQFHHRFLKSVELIEQQEAQAGLQRFQARQQLNQQLTQETIRNLASVLKPKSDGMWQLETPLLIAAGAVGKCLGVAIEPPMKSEDLKRVKEPLEAIARSSQLRLRRVLLRDGWWKKDGGPILAYTRDRYPVALLPVSGSHYELFDPIEAGLVNPDSEAVPTARSAAGRSVSGKSGKSTASNLLVNEEVAATLNPVAYVFYQPLPHTALQAIDLLKFALKGRRQDLIIILLTGVVATLLGMLVPQATVILIDNAIPYGDIGLLQQIGLGLLAAAFGGASFQLAQAIASMRIETISDASLQAAVWDRLLKLETSFFRQYSIGDLNSRVSGISVIRRKLSGTTLQTIFSGSFSLLNLGLLFYYSSPLAWLAMGVATVIIGVTTISGGLLVRRNRPLMELEGNIFGLLVQLINGIPKLRVAGVEERAFAYWGRSYTKQLQLLLSMQQIEDLTSLFNTIMPTLTSVALFWLASTLMGSTELMGASKLSVGTFLAFNVAFGTFVSGVTNLSTTLIETLDVIPLWQRSQPILTARPEVGLDKVDPGRLSGNIRIDHLTFRYREDGPLILDDVCIQAQEGEFIALVGPSGSGKSTIIRLLLGFESPNSGAVYYDGQDLMGLDVTAIRRQLGVVLQQGRISAGSIFENIAGGAMITLDDAWLAAEMGGFADDVRAMPMQMHTMISEGGTNLSGGQRQRLVIARALALKPKVLLLDEATSALDNQTQAIVSQSLDRLKVTRIVIAHRLSTIRNADRIYVLEAGRVVQKGKFDDLVKQPGLFAQLTRRQMA